MRRDSGGFRMLCSGKGRKAMTGSRVATLRDGSGKVEVVKIPVSVGREEWIVAHWFDRPTASGQAGHGIEGPYASRHDAEAAANAAHDLGDYDDVPDGVDPLLWAEAPVELREDLRERYFSP